jgi:hypothetical protein
MPTSGSDSTVLRMSSFFHHQVPFQPLFNNIGKSPAFQKGDFSATFSPIFNDPTLTL